MSDPVDMMEEFKKGQEAEFQSVLRAEKDWQKERDAENRFHLRGKMPRLHVGLERMWAQRGQLKEQHKDMER
jgi:hypothetical protein